MVLHVAASPLPASQLACAHLEASQRVNVQVVGRLVQQQQVSALLERLGQVQAVALAARQVADGLALVVALKVVPRAVGAGRHLRTHIRCGGNVARVHVLCGEVASPTAPAG
eukprot:361073-Chlamydomonas_euryale.AAC.5